MTVRLAIVAARFNAEITDRMVKRAVARAKELGVAVHVVRVPPDGDGEADRSRHHGSRDDGQGRDAANRQRGPRGRRRCIDGARSARPPARAARAVTLGERPRRNLYLKPPGLSPNTANVGRPSETLLPWRTLRLSNPF
ncbi:MAG: 6,7-dimethyl-8-ribityllumazine synthase [Methanobacteriota archaeon]|nr:MAG: 6,7-dimethyl-8-ribityllumazine synthase [Euryarchaeota archaeon]